jgi:hypothetical protein
VAAIRRAWEDAAIDQRIVTAERFYHERAAGKQQSWRSFVTGQEKGLLPKSWDFRKRNIVIFNSSEDEFSSIGDEWKNPLYTTQVKAVRAIVDDLSAHDGLHVYLRMHPNLAGVDNDSVQDLFAIRADNFTVIPPDSRVSSYELLKACNTVISFGSTVGIEAAFWGKPSILAGKCFYRDLGSVYLPETHEELVRMALSDLPPKDRGGALMYGYYMNTYGRPFKYYKADTLFSGTYRGQSTRAPFLARLTRRLIKAMYLQKSIRFRRLLGHSLRMLS